MAQPSPAPEPSRRSGGAAGHAPARAAAAEPGFGRSLGRFSLRVGIGTGLAVALYLALASRIERGQQRISLSPLEREDSSSSDTPAPAEAPPVARASPGPDAGLGPLARDVEARHARGELSELQGRLQACPGGDVRRVGWIDAEQRVRKLTRDRSDGATIEQWYDPGGRLGEARVRGAPSRGVAWTRLVSVAADGRETVVDFAGPPSGVELPALVRGDPTSALFAPPGCGAGP